MGRFRKLWFSLAWQSKFGHQLAQPPELIVLETQPKGVSLNAHVYLSTYLAYFSIVVLCIKY